MSIFDKVADQVPSQQVTPQTQAAPAAQAKADPGLGIFGRIGNAEVSRQGVYPTPGVYPALYVDVIKVITSRKGDDLFTVEFLILESQVAERPAGSKMTWQTNMKHDAGPGNARALIAAVMGAPIEEVDPQAAAMTCSDANPCHGRLVRLEAVNITTKAGNPFTKADWSPIAEENQVQAEALRVQVFGA